ncbi:MAG: phosphomannomutase/phosphoglucomutase [Chloroflexota bacterium]
MANLKKTMFREYDLRGLVNDEEINEDSVVIIAKAYGTMLRKRGIEKTVVGYDLRTGSKELSEIAIDGLLASGVDVVALGQVLTPIMYAAQYHYETKGGMMVTASHNPNGWLGFKLALGFSYTLGPDEMKELHQLTISEDFISGEGTREDVDYIPIFAKDLLGRVKITRPVKVVVNAGNGTAGPIVPEILRAAGCEVVDFLTEPDLDFKHYFPNPSKVEMMEDTGRETVSSGAEVGFAFDGDGDRLGITDEKGNVIWPDRYMAILSRDILAAHPGSTIVYDVKSSRALGEDIAAHKGKPLMWKTGHSYIKQKLHETGAPFAGEMSGHIFFGPPIYYGFDDAVFTALKMAEVLSKSEQSFSEMIAEIPTYLATPTLQASCPDEIKYEIVGKIVEELQAEGYDVVTFDNNPKAGGRIEHPDGWGLIRASSNLPVLVLRFEANSQEKLEELQALVKSKMDQYDEIGKEWESG